MRTVVLVLVVLLSACRVSPETKVRTALDVAGRTVDTAYAVAMERCQDKEQAVIVASRAGSIDPVRAWDEFNGIAQKCYQLRAAFDFVRSLHEEAATLMGSGKVDEARAVLRQLQDAWLRLRADTGAESEVIDPWTRGEP